MNCRTEDGDCKKSADSAQPRCPLRAVLYVVCVKWTWKLLSCYIVTTLSTLSHAVFELMNRCEDDDVVMEF